MSASWIPDGRNEKVGSYTAPGLFVGDALALAEELPDDSIDACVTSPPYFRKRDYGVDGQYGAGEFDVYIYDELLPLFREIRRALRPTGSLWLNLGDGYARDAGGNMGQALHAGLAPGSKYEGALASRPGVPIGFKHKDLFLAPHRVAIALQDDGWWVRQDIVWEKTNPMPESMRGKPDRPTRSHEYVFQLTKAPTYYFNADALREPHSEESKARQQRRRSEAHKYTDGGPDVQTLADNMEHALHPKGRNTRSVWSFATAQYSEAHFAVMPDELARRCILAATPPFGRCPKCGNVVRCTQRGKWTTDCRCRAGWEPSIILDPFLGAGTTALVAEQLGRRWLGFDIDLENVSRVRRRLRHVQGALFGEGFV